MSKSTRPLFIYILLAMFSIAMLNGCGPEEPTGPAAENLAKGKAFMEKNRTRGGVVTLENGIQYEIIKEGNGKSPRLTDIVFIRHRGKHLDGSVFSDSYKDETPEEIYVKHSIPGWKKTLPLMSSGAKWVIYLPPHMGFSNRGAEGIIEPNETLIYEIELVGIKW